MSCSASPTILVHEWVTGAGLAGSPLPGSWAAEGRAMRRAVAADFAHLPGVVSRVLVTLDPRLPDDPGPWTILRLDEEAQPQWLYQLAEQADYTVLIAPETMGVLARLTRGLEHAGARLLGCSAEAIELAGDKARLAAWLKARGIATPESRIIVPAEGLPTDAIYPAVLKPVDGAGTIDTWYVAVLRGIY